MLRILGSSKRLCDGTTRRDLLRAGAAGCFGLSLADLFAAEHATSRGGSSPSSTFGRAKHCIVLFLYGAPSQLDTFDPKPQATAEIRGPFGSIETALPGV